MGHFWRKVCIFYFLHDKLSHVQLWTVQNGSCTIFSLCQMALLAKWIGCTWVTKYLKVPFDTLRYFVSICKVCMRGSSDRTAHTYLTYREYPLDAQDQCGIKKCMFCAFRLALFLSIQWILHRMRNSYVSIRMSRIDTYERRILRVSNGCRNVIGPSKALYTYFWMTYRTAASIGCSWRAMHERVRFGLEQPNRLYTFMHRSPRVCIARKRAINQTKA